MENKKPISKIASLREQRGLTQLALSQTVGVTENTIANWEKGRSGVDLIEKLIKLCEALECELKDLIEYESTGSVDSGLRGLSVEEIHSYFKDNQS